jgi:CrcB protein
MPAWVAIGLAGALGAWARYLVGLAMQRHAADFPWGTFTVNVAGCVLIALALGIADRVPSWSFALRGMFATGFVGAFTTMSTFSLETWTLLQSSPLRAAGYVVASVAGGLCGVALGGWAAGHVPL